MKLTPKQREALQKLVEFGPMGVNEIYDRGNSNMVTLIKKDLAYHCGHGIYNITDLGRKTITENITKITAPATLQINLSAYDVAAFERIISCCQEILPLSDKEQKLYNRLQSEIEKFKALRSE